MLNKTISSQIKKKFVNRRSFLAGASAADYENRTEWHHIYAWRDLSKFTKTLQKDSSLTWKAFSAIAKQRMKSRAPPFKHQIAKIHAINIKRLSKV